MPRPFNPITATRSVSFGPVRRPDIAAMAGIGTAAAASRAIESSRNLLREILSMVIRPSWQGEGDQTRESGHGACLPSAEFHEPQDFSSSRAFWSAAARHRYARHDTDSPFVSTHMHPV